MAFFDWFKGKRDKGQKDPSGALMAKFLLEVMAWPQEEAVFATNASGGYFINDRERVLGSLPYLTGRYRDATLAHLKEAQERKRQKGLPFIPLEELVPAPKGEDMFSDPLSKQLMGMFIESVVEDRLHYERTGERPETRLIPHKRIKLDIMVKAYESDLRRSIAEVQRDATLTATAKAAEVKRIEGEVAGLIYRLKREPFTSMDAIFEQMKRGRTDLRAIEEEVRREQPLYNRLDGLKDFLT